MTQRDIHPSDKNADTVLNYLVLRSARDAQRISLTKLFPDSFRRFISGFSVLVTNNYMICLERMHLLNSLAENSVFETLKQFLASEPVLSTYTIYSPRLETELHCDASASRYDGILLQKTQNDSTWSSISFWSQRTIATESKYLQ